MDNNRTYTVKQVARLLGFSTNTVYKYLDEGKIRATRLGSSGRFRIPEEEVERLVGEKEEGHPAASPIQHEKPVTPHEIETPAEEERVDINEQLLSEVRDIYSPGLFDWFISTLSIFLGLSFFLFPGYVQFSNFAPYSLFHLIAKILLIIFGLILMAIDIFAHKIKFLRISVTLILAAIFISLSLPVFLTGNYLNAFSNFSIGIFLILYLLVKINDFFKFIFLILLMAGVSGASFIFNPSYFPNLPVSFWILDNRSLFAALWFSTFLLVLMGGIWGYFKHKTILLLSFLLIAAGSFVYASFAISNAQWEQSTYAIIFGSFALIFPAWRKFESLAKYSRKELIQSFIWFSGVLAAGVTIVIFVQAAFLNFSASENQRAIDTAKSTIYSFLSQNQDDISRFGEDKELLALMADPEKNFDAIDLLIKKDYENTTTVRRLFTLDKNGKGLMIYPREPNFTGTDFSDRDYFYISRQQKKLTVSDAVKPRVGTAAVAILMGFPLFDDNGNFLGMIAGSLDFEKLTQKLNDIKFGSNGEFVIADSRGRIIIHPDPKFILTPIEAGGALENAIHGKAGISQSYDEDGHLALKSYSSLDVYGWGIKAQQHIGEIVKNTSRTSFVIFVIAIASGTGSLISALYLKRR